MASEGSAGSRLAIVGLSVARGELLDGNVFEPPPPFFTFFLILEEKKIADHEHALNDLF